jgi:hypothetical protein
MKRHGLLIHIVSSHLDLIEAKAKELAAVIGCQSLNLRRQYESPSCAGGKVAGFSVWAGDYLHAVKAEAMQAGCTVVTFCYMPKPVSHRHAFVPPSHIQDADVVAVVDELGHFVLAKAPGGINVRVRNEPTSDREYFEQRRKALLGY